MPRTASASQASSMTTSDTFGGAAAPSPATGSRLLRRNKSNRVAAGVASGLGEYFGVDPVLFRVLFATSAFFGGAGILAYVLAWAAIPEAGAQTGPGRRLGPPPPGPRRPPWGRRVRGGFFPSGPAV